MTWLGLWMTTTIDTPDTTPTDVDWAELRERSLGTTAATTSLPPSVATLVRALELFATNGDSPVDQRELTRIIASDARLEREVNRQLRFNLQGDHHAKAQLETIVEDLGVRPAQLVLISSGIHAVKKFSKSKLISGRNFWAANHERALFAWEVAGMLGTDRRLAFTAALVQDFLLPYLSTEFFAQYLQFVEGESGDEELSEFERTTFGWDHARAGAGVMASWGFPDDLVCCVLLHHGGFDVLATKQLRRTAVAAVAIASLIPESLGQAPAGLQELVRLQECWGRLRSARDRPPR